MTLFNTRSPFKLIQQYHSKLVSIFFLLICLHCGFAYAAQIDAPNAVRQQDAQRFEKNLSRGEPAPAWVEPDAGAPIADPGSTGPLVIRLSDVQTYVDAKATTYVHRMMQVNEASMLTMAGRIEIPFHPEYQQVALHSLRVVRGVQAIDKTNTADIRYLQMESGLDSGIFTGLVTASIVVDDVRVGDIVDIAYSTTGQNPVFDGHFFQILTWDSSFPTLHKRIRLNTPVNRPIKYQIIGQGPGNIQNKEEQAGNRKIITFSADQMKPIEFEPYVPNDTFQFRAIQFSEFSQWHQVNQWAQALFDVKTSSAEVDKVVAGLRGAANSDETVQQALAYVQNEIRYLSISIGENSHKPFPPEVVLSRRYGDCKDKSLLLVTLLRKLGIDASPVLISSSSPKMTGKMLPAPTVFDHAIIRAKVNGKTYYLDPTRAAQYGPLANMGQVHEGAEVLVIEKDSHELAAIPKKEEGTATVNGRREQVRLDKLDGVAEFKVTHQFSGIEAENARFYIGRQSKEQLKNGLIASVLRRYPNAELKSGPTVSDNRQANTLNIELNFQIPDFLVKNSAGWQMRYQASNLRERFYVPENPKRKLALAVPAQPALIRYELEVSLPQEMDANYKPSISKIEDPAFLATEMLTFKGNVYRAAIELRKLKDRVAPQEVVDFMADTRKVGNMLDGSIQIRKTDVRGFKDGKPKIELPIKQKIAEELDELIRSKTMLINEARANGSNAASALCERSLAYARVGKKADALTDLQAAQKEGADAQEVLQCRSRVLYAVGVFKDSESDSARLLSQDTANGKLYMLRAMSLFGLGRWRDAADSFALAAGQMNGSQDKIRANIMRQLALRRQNPQASLAMTVDDNEDWLNAMLAATNTNGTAEEQVLRQVHKHTGAELDAALAEAYFYLAQLNIVGGNKIKAMVYMQRSVEKGILTADYRPLAEFEAERLKKNK